MTDNPEVVIYSRIKYIFFEKANVVAIPRFFAYCGFFLLPFSFLVVYKNFLFADMMFGLAGGSAILIRLVNQRQRLDVFWRENEFRIPILLLTCGFLISLGTAREPMEAVTAFIQVLFIFLFLYPTMVMLVDDRRFMKISLLLLLISSSVIGFLMLVFYLFGFDLSAGLFLLQEGWRGRFSYGGMEPNIPARIILQAVPVLLAIVFLSKRLSTITVNTLIALSLLFVILITASRSASLSAALGLFFFFLFLKQASPGKTLIQKKHILVLLLLLFSASLFAARAGVEIDLGHPVDRIAGMFELKRSGSSIERISILDQASQQIVEHPLIGVGFANYQLYTAERTNVHNPVVSLWAETGFAGMLGFLFIYLSLVRFLNLGWRRHFFRDYYLVALAGIVFMMILGDMFMANSYKRVLWAPALLFVAQVRHLNITHTMDSPSETASGR